ncbi:nitrate reductase molybdenum cofactor assembly chaperone [Saccharothrix luteola]|uniref:nitrate reductase molybdenum cofactor assembly chaperone n=1 Tax=Saccharothrix luteola TaxID=2893018 RepID=UPI001E3C750E|nr:nitrate reductase molybdenum cofactor assembly chaperone [Saccharothrix luteola]MCC8243184.1 nitrate reductase molybdenum cofactor assembly chaperone [Saccharothrix luteola]
MSVLRKRDKKVAEAPDRESRLVWRIAALLIDYPGEAMTRLLPELRAAAGSLPAPAGPALVSFVDHAASSAGSALAQHYVETFDLRKRNCLHLSYYAYGDTRKRGMALLRFKHAYRAAGVELGEHELPDHLAVVLEFAATADPIAGRRLLVEHRPVLEMIRLSLADGGSPYLAVLDAVCATLPEISAADLRKIATLAAEGPPEEDVGLEPFAMDPALHAEAGGRR